MRVLTTEARTESSAAPRPARRASSSAMSRARHTRLVRGMRCWRVACWAETRRSHSRARAAASGALDSGSRTTFFVPGCRTGRASRCTSQAPSTSRTCTSSQNRFRRGAAPPFFLFFMFSLPPPPPPCLDDDLSDDLPPASARISRAFSNISACFRRLSTRACSLSAAGCGGSGGGPCP